MVEHVAVAIFRSAVTGKGIRRWVFVLGPVVEGKACLLSGDFPECILMRIEGMQDWSKLTAQLQDEKAENPPSRAASVRNTTS